VSRIYIIAEAGVNHNGSIELAKQLIEAAAVSGADAVKFQTFKTEKLVSRSAPKALYQLAVTDREESQFEMLKRLELDRGTHEQLIEHCRKAGIQFLSTPFDLESVDLLANTLNLPRIKLPSGEITNGPLLLKAARTGKPVILSTGMSTLADVGAALGVLAFGYTSSPDELPFEGAFEKAFASEAGQASLRSMVTLLHCTTAYPTPYNDVHLLAMDTLKHAFGIPCGYSDHTLGIAVPIAAAARGAVMIEKHFTMDRNLPGPDHQASLEPKELKEMVNSIRQVEQAFGSAYKKPTEEELANRKVARKSLVAARAIKAGERYTEYNVEVKRPGMGISPIRYWDLLGKAASRDYMEDEAIE
jgi:N-acetylneuraminate synthase